MLYEIIKEKKLPGFLPREQMLDILQREEYGYLPEKPESISFEEQDFIPNFCAGKAVCKKVEVKVRICGKEFSFPIYATIPTKAGKYPYYICINFRDAVPDRYLPCEEIIDNGFGVISFCYKDVTSDDGDFTNGLAGVLFENGKRKSCDAGKLAMWAWAAQRALDYAYTLENFDPECAIVCGHSRLGKTALLAAATDERFRFCHSNDSGCSGSAISRGKDGETIAKIVKVFPYWFCENYYKYADREYECPFDQHFLASCIAPRFVYIASAVEDGWADPMHEMLNCVAISEVYEKMGHCGFVCEDRLPVVGDEYHEGRVGYHLRAGTHYFGRDDWLKVMKFIKRHMEEK